MEQEEESIFMATFKTTQTLNNVVKNSLSLLKPVPMKSPTLWGRGRQLLKKAMAFLLPTVSSSLLHPKSKDRTSSSSCFPSSSSQKLSSQSQALKSINSISRLSLSALTSLQTLKAQGSLMSNCSRSLDKQRGDDFYVNLGLVMRTLREDMPSIFSKDLNYDIYRWFSLLDNVYICGLLAGPMIVSSISDPFFLERTVFMVTAVLHLMSSLSMLD